MSSFCDSPGGGMITLDFIVCNCIGTVELGYEHLIRILMWWVLYWQKLLLQQCFHHSDLFYVFWVVLSRLNVQFESISRYWVCRFNMNCCTWKTCENTPISFNFFETFLHQDGTKYINTTVCEWWLLGKFFSWQVSYFLLTYTSSS